MGTAGSVRAAARLLLAATVAAVAVGCSNGTEDTTITVGAGDSAQSRLIAEIYAQALARTGAHTVVRDRLGQRADYLAALDAGTITVVGDTSGDLLRTFDSTASATAPDDAVAADIADHRTTSAVPSAPGTSAPAPSAPGAPVVAPSLPGTSVAAPSVPDTSGEAPSTPGTSAPAPAASDTSGEVRADSGTTSVASQLSRSLPEGLVVSDIADATDLRAQLALAPTTHLPADAKALASHCGEISLGIATGHELDPLRTPPDPQRDVLTPLHETYGCDITRHTVFGSDSELRQALLDGRVDAGVFTSAAELLPGGAGDLAVVADPDYAFRAQNVIPLMRQGALDQDRIKKLNYVAGELTTAEFAALIRRVRDGHESAPDVARGWLDEHAL
ncbi:putative ABC-type transporter system, substrate-binding protein [Nocardia nova SH22a]|uniref:Putative ABC-type transporter system, substrate-binding protein n=1 Tax=Nocardia nova SH22a TaxID=1415166 RepID=W5TPT8_9NOCA|nr:glycine betaine ABC transporter substrate-binding protein [Nocardia nova]AHH21174.1 putative ABC-type transporter system, substrate-binding protein [Nocardia nova SH22a]